MAKSVRFLSFCEAVLCRPLVFFRIHSAAGWWVGLATLIVMGIGASGVYGQTLKTTSLATPAFGLSKPSGVAVDSQGTVYVAEGSKATIKSIPAGCKASSCITTLGGGFTSPVAVAVDASGYLYIGDAGGQTIKKMPAACASASCVSTLIASGVTPLSLAVDGSGNIYVGDMASESVFRVAANCSTSSCPRTTILANLSLPNVTVDSGGNLFIASASDAALYRLPAGCSSSSCAVQLGGTLSAILGISTDRAGAAYVVSSETVVNPVPPHNVVMTSSVKKVPADCLSSACVQKIIGNIAGQSGNTLYGVAVDALGNIYATNYQTGDLYEYAENAPVPFASTPVGTPGPTGILTFTFVTGGQIGAPVVTTEGVTGADFIDAGGGTCTTNGASHTYAAGETCTVMVNFSPRYPGLRRGALQMKSSSGTLLTTIYLSGTGTGPQAVLGPASVATLGGGLNTPGGVAVDGSGTIFVTDGSNSVLYKIPGNCQTTACTQTLAAGFILPVGIAVDGAGSVFVSDQGRGIMKLPAGCTSGSCASVVVSLNGDSFSGIAVDGSGYLYVGDSSIGAVRKVPPGCAVLSCMITIGGGFNAPLGVAVDADGNVYVGDSLNNAVKVIPPGCLSSSCVTSLGGGFTRPSGVAVGGGALYVGDYGNNVVKTMPLSCAAAGCVASLAGTASNSRNVAVDAAGNVYLIDTARHAVSELTRTVAPTLAFAVTQVGQTSTDSPQTVTVYNIGNQPLTLTNPASGTNPSASASYVLNTSGTLACPSISTISSPGALAAGYSCTLPLSFVPAKAGSNDGSVFVTDNSLNASPSTTQTAQFYGTGIGSGAPTVTVSAQTTSLGKAFTLLTVTISYGGTAPTGAVSFTVASGVTVAGTCGTRGAGSFACTAAYPTDSLPVGTYTITASIASDGNYSLGAGSNTLTVNRLPVQFITLPTASPILLGQTLAASTLTGGQTTTTGTFAWTNSSTVPVVGTNAYSVTFTPTDTYTYNTATTAVNVTVNAGFGAIATTNLAANQVTLQLTSTVTGTGYFTMLPGSGATCGSVAQTADGVSPLNSAVIHGSVKLSANVAASYTVRNLMQSSPYTVCFTPDGVSSVATSTVTTKAAVVPSTSNWTALGTAGFSNGTALYTSMAFAPDGTPYIAYQDAGNSSKATVMKWNGAAWTLVGPAGLSAAAATNISLVFGPDGTPYVSYQDGSYGQRVTVMKFDGTQWVAVGNATFTPAIAPYPSLAIGPDNVVYAAYQDIEQGSKVTVRKFDGSSWVVVGSAGFTGGASTNISLMFSPNGILYVAYTDGGNSNKASMMRYLAGIWTEMGNTGFSAGTAQYTRLAFAPDSTPYVAYEDAGNNNRATVMKFNGSTWSAVGSAGFSVGQAQFLSLAFDPSGAPNLAYQDIGNSSKATVMKFNGVSWTPLGSVGFSPDIVGHVSLAFSPYGIPHVSFENGGSSNKATVMRLNDVPSAVTSDATDVTASGATLNGTVNGNGVAASAMFEYGTTASYGSTVSAGPVTAGSGSTAVAGNISSLLPNTTYHFRVSVSADGTVVNGADKMFTTAKVASSVLTLPTASMIQYGQSLASSMLSGGSANTPGVFSWTNSAIVPGSGVSSYSVTFTPSNSSYLPVTSVVAITVVGNDVFLAGSGSAGAVYGNGDLLMSATSLGGSAVAVDANGYVWSLYNGASTMRFDHLGQIDGTMPLLYGLSGARALAIDGSTQVWISNGNGLLYVQSGASLSPVAVSEGSSGSAAAAIAIDHSGNIWLTNSSTNTVDEVIGIADPVAPLANAVQSNTLGVRP